MRTFDPFRLLLIFVAGWLGQQKRDAIDFLRKRCVSSGRVTGYSDKDAPRLAAIRQD